MRLGLAMPLALFTLVAGCASGTRRANPASQSAASAVPAASESGADAGPEAIFQEFNPAQVERIVATREYVEAAAREYDLEEELIYGVIWVESRFQPRAKSPAGARGLMQLMPQTATALAKQMGVARPLSYDPKFNVRAGSYYLRRLVDRYEGDEALALAAYHAGAGNVNKWMKAGDGLPEFSKKYVSAVFDARARFRGTPLDAEREQMLARSKPGPVIEPDSRPDPPKLPAKFEQPPEDEPDDFEPVFERRPDLDVAQSGKEPPPRRRVQSRSATETSQVGVGLLPSVDD